MRSLLLILTFMSGMLMSSCNREEKETAAPVAKSTDPVFAAGCSELLSRATRMDSILMTQLEIDTVSAYAAMRAFTEFAHNCSRDTTSAIYLIKTAQVARAVNNIPQAKLALDRCIDEYTGFSGRPAAMFLLAQIYEGHNYLNNAYDARKMYERIIEEYPKSEWAANAKAAIPYIGKSDAEIIKDLKKKRK
jgi:TolA-binding protein